MSAIPFRWLSKRSSTAPSLHTICWILFCIRLSYNQCFGTGSGSGTFWVEAEAEAEAIFENHLEAEAEAEALVKKILEVEAEAI